MLLLRLNKTNTIEIIHSSGDKMSIEMPDRSKIDFVYLGFIGSKSEFNIGRSDANADSDTRGNK